MLTLFDGEVYRRRDSLYREVSRDERRVRYQVRFTDDPPDCWLDFLNNPDVRSF